MGDSAAAAKPESRGKTPHVPTAASTVSFALGKKLQAAFDEVDVERAKLIDMGQFAEFLAKMGIPGRAEELARIATAIQHDHDTAGRANGLKLSYEDVLELLNSPHYTFCLYVEETMSKDRRDGARIFLKAILGDDDEARERVIAHPPTQLLGDKQVVRKVAVEMHNLKHPEQIRVCLARALSAIAEKPREVSGRQPPPGHKRNMMLDNKAIAACLFTLAQGKQIFVDKRSFYNPEPRTGDPSADPPVGVGLAQAARDWRKRVEEIRRPLECHDAVPQDYCARPEYYVPMHEPANEPSEVVRVEAVLVLAKLGTHETEVIVKALLRSAAHDVSWAVRAAAVEQLGHMARELRKLGFKVIVADSLK
jgi:hypothetical protein